MDSTQDARLTLRGLEIFVAVARSGSLGAGGRALGAAASTISQQISNLETALGVCLIDRRSRPMMLTPAGRLFLGRAIAVLDELAHGRAEIANLDLSAVRGLSLAMVEDLDAVVLPELLVRLAGVFPQCAFTARSAPSHENLAALEARVSDLAVLAGDPPENEALETHPIVRDPMVLVTAPGLLAGDGLPLDFLKEAPMVRFEGSQRIARQSEANLRRNGISPSRRFEVQTNPAMMGLVARARGWAISTALGFLSAGDAARGVEAHPVPFSTSARVLWVCARAGELGSLPHAVSEVLRAVVEDRLVKAGHAQLAWLGEEFRVLRKSAGNPNSSFGKTESGR